MTRPTGRTTAIVTLRLPLDLLEALDAKPGQRSEVVRSAVAAYLFGGVERWHQRFLREQALRLRLEQKLLNAKEALDA